MKVKKIIRGFLSPKFVADFFLFRRQMRATQSPFKFGRLHPILKDLNEENGTINRIYFLQDLFVAQEIFKMNPTRHVDVGSSVAGFVGHVASFREIEVFDVRPLALEMRNVQFKKRDFIADLTDDLIECTDSLSCLHALEHFGLGRYGDPVDVDGHEKGFENLARMVKPGGMLYLSVPLGPLRVEFNAHRVFSASYLFALVKRHFDVKTFTYVSDNKKIHIDVPIDDEAIKNNFGCKYGCAIFCLRKR